MTKGTIRKDIFRGDRYTVIVGAAILTDCIKVTAGARKAKKVDLPDFTVAASTVVEAGEFDLTFPAHHAETLAIMDTWFNLTSAGSTPASEAATYVPVSVIQMSNTGLALRTILFNGCFVVERSEPEFAFQDADKMTEITYKLSYDECTVV